MAKHVKIDWLSIIGYRITANLLEYINQTVERATEILSKVITINTTAYRNESGLFFKPGILTSRLGSPIEENDLGIYIDVVGSIYYLHIRPGKAVTYKGNVIEVDTETTLSYNDPDLLRNKTVVLVYKTVDSDEVPIAQTFHPVTGATAIPVKMKTFDVILANYNPITDEYLNSLPYDGNYVPIGKINDDLSISYEDGHRRIALVNIPFLGYRNALGFGHWATEFNPISDFNTRNHSIYNFFACKGSASRTTNNPLGLTPEDLGFSWDHLYVSHMSGFSTWPTTTFEATLVSSDTIRIEPITEGEWVYLVDHDNYLILTHDDIPAAMVYTPSGMQDRHYYLLRIYSSDPTVPSFDFEIVDLGDNENSAIATLRNLYTQRHKEDAPDSRGWIGLAIFRYVAGTGIVTTGSAHFSNDFWIKDSLSGEHIWNAYRAFHATTTSTSAINHDGRAITPAVSMITGWWQTNSKLLRDIIDYIFDVMVKTTDLMDHKNKKCDGSTALVNASPSPHSQHWVDAIRIDGNSPPYFNDLYATIEWNEQCGRSVDRLFRKLSELRRIKRNDYEYIQETPPAGTVKSGGIPFTQVNRYAYWSSQIALESELSGVENQYHLNTIQLNNLMLKDKNLILEFNNDIAILSFDQNIAAVSEIPGTTDILVVRARAVITGGNLTGIHFYFYVVNRNNLSNFDWNSPVYDEVVNVTALSNFVRFEPSFKIVWYGNRYFYMFVEAFGYSSSPARNVFGSYIIGYKYDGSTFSRVANQSSDISSVSNTAQSSYLRINDILVDGNTLFATYSYYSGSLYLRVQRYTISNDGSLTPLGTAYNLATAVYGGSVSIFKDSITGNVIFVVACNSSSGVLEIREYSWDGTNYNNITPYSVLRLLELISSTNITPICYANERGAYISIIYNETASYIIGTFHKSHSVISDNLGYFVKFWRRSDDLLPILSVQRVSGATLNYFVEAVLKTNSSHFLPSSRTVCQVPQSDVALVGGAFSDGMSFSNSVVLPDWAGTIQNLSGREVAWPNWCISDKKGETGLIYSYLSVKDFYFIAVGWKNSPAGDNYLVFSVFTLGPWEAF